MLGQVNFIHIAQNHKSHSLSGLYNLYSVHPLSLVPQVKGGKTLHKKKLFNRKREKSQEEPQRRDPEQSIKITEYTD